MEKSLREDNALAERPLARRGAAHEDEGDDRAVDRKPSMLWLAQDSAKEEAAAREGTRGTASELPYRAELEQALGTDLSQLKAYTGDHAQHASDRLGAQAYAMRDQQAVVFGDASPTKELVAHEVVHTLQRGGGAISQDEAEADAIGGRIAAGERVDARAIKSGGGKVRKKEKANLSKVFEDFLKGCEAEARARYGEDATAEDADAEAHRRDGDRALEETATGRKALADDGAFTSSDREDEVTFTGTKLDISSEETVREGRVDPAHAATAVQQKITSARGEIIWLKFDRNMKLMGARHARAGLERDLEALDAEGLDPALVAAKRGVLVDKIATRRTQIGELERAVADLDEVAAELDRSEALLATTDPAKIALRLADAEATFVGKATTRKRSFGFDVLAGTLNRAVEVERADGDEAGTTTNGRSRGQNVKIGGGVAVETVRGRKQARTDTDDNTTGTETSVASTSKLIAGEDGSVGVGKGKKLAGAIENSFGKATGGAGLDGAVTANIIEIPREEGQAKLYAVVVTINVGLALEVGLEQERQLGKQPDRAKLAASLSAKGGAEGQLTQTHVLDQQEVKRYLAALDKAANGTKPSGDQPELDMLYKAVNGLGSVAEILGGAAATMGSSDAAKAMKVDESVELTTKVSGAADASLGAGGVGASGGAKGELYRTMKIGRVAGKPGQELVEITVSFGDSSDMHGALTGKALGVSASYGAKVWDSSQEAVTFRLDDAQPDYAYLYDEIVGTMSRSSLLELRQSRRFAKHVQAYASTTSTGSEEAMAISGLVGVADKNTRARTSERGMEDGDFTAAETGTQARSTGFSVGPLELLRRSQTDGARFDIQDGMSMLDISETTDASWLGKFDPSAKDLLTSESPAKAAEKALLETHTKLEGFFLDPEDIDILVDKAKHEPQAWANVAYQVDGGLDDERAIAWEALRRQLAKPTIPNDPGVPLHLARDLALGTAVADFMANGSDAKGADYVRVVLRGWRRAGGADGTGGGTLYEFPADVSAAKYKEVRRKCKGLPVALATFVPDGQNGVAPGMEYIAELQYDLAKVLNSVEESYGYESERARMEMIAELRELAAGIPAAKRELQRQCTGVEPSEDELLHDALADDKAQVRALEDTLDKSKISEQWLLDRLQRRVDDYEGGERAEQMAPLIENLEEMYALHTSLIRQLRAAYTAACLDSGGWRCSKHGRDERKPLDIDYERFVRLFTTYRKAQPYGFGVHNLERDLETKQHDYRLY